MKKISLSFSLILVLACLSLQPVLASSPIFNGLSKFIKQDREVKNFNGVVAGGPINVVITLGNTEGLRFEGDAAAIATLITEVVGNKLIIRPQNSWTSWAKKYENKKIIAYVSAKTIQGLTMSGNGTMSVTGKIIENTLTATLSGSGNITANATTKSFIGVISGSGNLNISGGADEATITVSGSGSFTNKNFTVDNLETMVSGSGSVYIIAKDNINAMISGSGTVNYSGSAQVEKRVVGTGKVRKM